MNIFNKTTLKEFSRKHANCKKQLELWYNDISEQNWKSSVDIRKNFAFASILNRNRVVFNIKGNDYRLIAEVNYERGSIFIKFIGTHSEYSKVDAETVSLYG